MTRSQRRIHRAVWLVLAPALLAAVVWALASGERYPSQELPAAVRKAR